ncbi:transglycosylase SLT domain-containing protein [Nitrosomonas sp.]|uniref:transglycosylase SLT domain-containing protein n=1 Tax=Nitrosomonas sp. TaxID=42353 RepID=UPI001D291AF7|nr:transglycosylase SLT domain-containing protein [Nitrosomonas sp.]MCB1948242.1 transglycosylase SLT domain-containing protein [Nitrosomonas sp.]
MNTIKFFFRPLFVLLLLSGLVGCTSNPPRQQDDLCAVFEQQPNWYDYARASEDKWGVPAHILMAFVRHESSYRHNAKPPFEWFLFIPLGRPSSAKGYAQIQDPAWQDYKKSTSGLFKSRSNMADALDFIGWYNHNSNQRLGISKWDPMNLYLAYHEGHGGYRRGTHRNKKWLLNVAGRVDFTAREYGAQLRRCDDQFRCRHWYQFWPFCS